MPPTNCQGKKRAVAKTSCQGKACGCHQQAAKINLVFASTSCEDFKLVAVTTRCVAKAKESLCLFLLEAKKSSDLWRSLLRSLGKAVIEEYAFSHRSQKLAALLCQEAKIGQPYGRPSRKPWGKRFLSLKSPPPSTFHKEETIFL